MFSISFRNPTDGSLKVKTSLSLLIQKSSLTRSNNVFPSVIYKPLNLISRYSNDRVPSLLKTYTMTGLTKQWCNQRPTHQARKPFYITPRRQKNRASRENYASELYQVSILRLSRVGRTSCYQMVEYGRVHFIVFQDLIPLFMKNWGKNDLFQTTWTQLYRLCPQHTPNIAGVTFFIH